MLELSSAYRGTALVLGDVIEADDGYTGEHCKSVVALTLDLAEHLDLCAERRRNLEFAALLHDVGKIAIPKEIINKPGKLDPHEWTIVKTHTRRGAEDARPCRRVHAPGRDRSSARITSAGTAAATPTASPASRSRSRPASSRAATPGTRCAPTVRTARRSRYDVAEAELRSASGTQLDPLLVDALLEIVPPSDRLSRPAAAQPRCSRCATAAA